MGLGTIRPWYPPSQCTNADPSLPACCALVCSPCAVSPAGAASPKHLAVKQAAVARIDGQPPQWVVLQAGGGKQGVRACAQLGS
jgi:hypothetical protein